jgi:hypothetical protein
MPAGYQSLINTQSTKMSDEPAWYSPDGKPLAARRLRAVGELLWEIYVERDHVVWRAELFDEKPHGCDVRIFRGGDF